MMFDLQKANIWKRISAKLFDFIIIGIIVVALAAILSAVTGFDKQYNDLNDAYARYEAEYGIKFDITQEEYLAMSEEGRANYDAAYKALCDDKEAIQAYNMVLSLTLMIVSISIGLAILIWDFIIPLILKNGQTVGKKIFGIAVMHTNGVKVDGIAMFIRTILGKFAIETMIPVVIILMIYFNAIGLLGPAIFGLILLLQVVLLICTQTNSCIHDLLAKTVTVDLASQMIFESEEAMMQYKNKMQAEKAKKSPY